MKIKYISEGFFPTVNKMKEKRDALSSVDSSTKIAALSNKANSLICKKIETQISKLLEDLEIYLFPETNSVLFRNRSFSQFGGWHCEHRFDCLHISKYEDEKLTCYLDMGQILYNDNTPNNDPIVLKLNKINDFLNLDKKEFINLTTSLGLSQLKNAAENILEVIEEDDARRFSLQKICDCEIEITDIIIHGYNDDGINVMTFAESDNFLVHLSMTDYKKDSEKILKHLSELFTFANIDELRYMLFKVNEKTDITYNNKEMTDFIADSVKLYITDIDYTVQVTVKDIEFECHHKYTSDGTFKKLLKRIEEENNRYIKSLNSIKILDAYYTSLANITYSLNLSNNEIYELYHSPVSAIERFPYSGNSEFIIIFSTDISSDNDPFKLNFSFSPRHLRRRGEKASPVGIRISLDIPSSVPVTSRFGEDYYVLPAPAEHIIRNDEQACDYLLGYYIHQKQGIRFKNWVDLRQFIEYWPAAGKDSEHRRIILSTCNRVKTNIAELKNLAISLQDRFYKIFKK